MNWQPIETYNKLKKKPKWAVFYVQAKVIPERKHASLPELVTTEYPFGSRIITH